MSHKEDFPLSSDPRASKLHQSSYSRSKKPDHTIPISPAQWNDWHWQVRNRMTTIAEIEKWMTLTVEEKRAIQFSHGRFHFSLTPYWVSLMDPNDFFCPIRRQAIPLDEEFKTSVYDHADFKTPQTKIASGRLTHFFPDRAVLSVHSQCIVYCRFCPQRKIAEDKRKVIQQGSLPPFLQAGEFPVISDEQWGEIDQYLRSHPEIHEVIITGGEPLLLNDDVLRKIFTRLKSIASIKTLRLETRIISVLPQRITPELVQILKEFQPLYFMLHVNHPAEISVEFSQACAMLVDSGVPLASETVLLHEINDRPQILSDLFLTLFKMRVRPYRLIQCLPSQGADHFRTSVSLGLRLLESLRGRMAELALPEYVVDTPGGKIPLRYESILSRNRKRILLKNYEGKIFVYPEKIFSFSS